MPPTLSWPQQPGSTRDECDPEASARLQTRAGQQGHGPWCGACSMRSLRRPSRWRPQGVGRQRDHLHHLRASHGEVPHDHGQRGGVRPLRGACLLPRLVECARRCQLWSVWSYALESAGCTTTTGSTSAMAASSCRSACSSAKIFQQWGTLSLLGPRISARTPAWLDRRP